MLLDDQSQQKGGHCRPVDSTGQTGHWGVDGLDHDVRRRSGTVIGQVGFGKVQQCRSRPKYQNALNSAPNAATLYIQSARLVYL